MKEKILAAVMLIGGLCIEAHGEESQAEVSASSHREGVSIVSIDELNIADSLKQRAKVRALQLQAQTVIQVSDLEVADFNEVEASHKKGAVMRGKSTGLTFSPANLDSTSLNASPQTGSLLHGGFVNGSRTGLSRLFEHPKLGLVVLEETDLRGGGRVTFTKESVNANVNGAPAVIVRQQAGRKKTIIILSWSADGMLYTLKAKSIDDPAKEEILNIAKNMKKTIQ